MSSILNILLCFSTLFVQIIPESCIDKFCPPGTFCDERPGPCVHPPCRTIFACLPNTANGCSRMQCPPGKLCVERVRPCIGRDCKKLATCEIPNTCDATVCDPSEKCEMIGGKPKCNSFIPPTRGIIGKAILDEKQFQNQ